MCSIAKIYSAKFKKKKKFRWTTKKKILVVIKTIYYIIVSAIAKINSAKSITEVPNAKINSAKLATFGPLDRENKFRENLCP